MGVIIFAAFLIPMGLIVYALCQAAQRADIEMGIYWSEQEEPTCKNRLSSSDQSEPKLLPIKSEMNTVELDQICAEFLQRYFSAESSVGDAILVPVKGIGMCYIEKVSN